MSLLLWLLDPVFWIKLLALALGAYLLVRGLRGRREGDEPHCRRCAYNLTGITSQRCPECGTAFTADDVIHGHRSRYLASLMIGALVLLGFLGLAGQIGYHKAWQLNWYNYRPFDWLLEEAEAGERDASDELLRRLRWRKLSPEEVSHLHTEGLRVVQKQPAPANLGTWFAMLKRLGDKERLSTDQIGTLTSAALSRVMAGGNDPRIGEWLDILRVAVAARRLSEDQIRDLAARAQSGIRDPVVWNRSIWLDVLDELGAGGQLQESELLAYFRACIEEPSLAVRPRIRSEECVPLDVSLNPKVQSPRHTHCRLIAHEVRIGDHVISESSTSESEKAQSPGARIYECRADWGLSVGTHELECRATYACALAPDAKRPSEAAYRGRVEIASSAKFEVLRPDASADLTLVNDPSMRETFRQHFQVQAAPRGHTDSTLYLVCQWTAGTPLDAVFNIRVRAGDREHDAGRLTCSKDSPQRNLIEFPRSLLGESGAGTVFLVLRSNPEEARKTVDVVEIWDGELTFGPIEIEGL